MKITYKNIQEAINNGYPVTVTINGELYELAGDPVKDAFIDGVNFAAAVIEDRRARMNLAASYNKTKKHRAYIDTVTGETKSIIDHLRYITLNGFNAWYNAYIGGGDFWRLKT